MIVLTAELDVAQRAHALGAWESLTKPFGPFKLLEAVERCFALDLR